jgi:hypothetical protein
LTFQFNIQFLPQNYNNIKKNKNNKNIYIRGSLC